MIQQIDAHHDAGDLVEVNSGGQVLFCFFAPAASVPAGEQRGSQSVDLGRVRDVSAGTPPAGVRLSYHPPSGMCLACGQGISILSIYCCPAQSELILQCR